MKINIKIILLIFVFSTIGYFALAPVTQAAGLEYPLLEKIPGTTGLGSDLPQYLSAVYKAALVVVTLSAVLMLSIGGFMYLTSAGNTSSISTAKGIITDSLIGLVIALSAWLILYIINPDLVEITLKVPPAADIVNFPRPSLGDPSALPSDDDKTLAEQILSDPDITLIPSGTCKLPSGDEVSPRSVITDIANGDRAAICTNGCTSATTGCIADATKLSHTMMAAMLTVGGTLSYTVTSISGGPHASKSSHYQGRALDIDTSAPENKAKAQALMDAFVAAGATSPSGNAASMCEDRAGQNVGCDPTTTADHLHIVFSN